MTWTDGTIEGCTLTPLKPFSDERGWLAEFFRHDELGTNLHPVMGYVSMTRPGVARGPHEHVEQTDLFVFFHGTFRLYLWDTRNDSPTKGVRAVYTVGEAEPAIILVPPGVVHAYKNTGSTDGLIVNCPNQLYAGVGKAQPVDEIRHEDLADSPFTLD
ncbi:MAG: dTDP-4-dehydrorhamnose 3,5-epimerase family protein [Rhodothermales bacterium]